ncbi:Hypothetical protein R9X50_00001000 [Acrodontium crateriforme]|uniref:Uncharacterized protein n=1 Tax=Acrodontium crateriforme TaxID=150365 RepID=A0AAQ3R4L0_9PEZI|nr:Hypothetical protein R9X50_00001000 [Acrodontium crateriforme]
MPVAEDLIANLDDLDKKPASPAETPITSAIGSWPSKKSKKKSKKNALVKPQKTCDEEEAIQRPVSITPPEDALASEEQTALPAALSPPIGTDEQTRLPASFLPVPIEWEDETTANEDTESEARPLPPVKSPPAQPAKLASPPPSPASRPAAVQIGPQHYAPSQARHSNSPQPINHVQRRESFGMTHTLQPRPRFVDPPPPHMPQSHFFGLPDIGLNFGQKQDQGKPAGSDGCCRFDSFDDAGHAPSARKARDALLVGSEGALDVYRVLPDKMEVIGRLEGLRGAVVDAKILPNLKGRDEGSTWPLIAVIIHGLMADEKITVGQDDEGSQESPKHYQTSVEVFSLQTQEHVATLYNSVPVALEAPTLGTLSLPPKPIGDLQLDAASNFVVLASGKSGEIFVFSKSMSFSSPKAAATSVFSCVGKFWTSLQTPIDMRNAGGNKEMGSTLPVTEQRRIPIFSLSNRWLAIVPPYTSAGISIQGSPLTDSQSPADINLNMAPVQPFITCEVAGIDAEGTLSWLSRKAAQGLLNASQKGYELGMQGWKELTQPTPVDRSGNHASPKDQEVFPPTNGPSDDPKRFNKEPALILLIDLHKLISSASEAKPLPPQLATFALVDGCNYMSFSPDGLRLMTANRKGEISTIWDLCNVAHGKTKLGSMDSDLEQGPHVKPLHRITRSSPSVILDSVWSRDGDWLAVLTANGTVHLHEIPLRSPYKKKKRRTTVTAPAASNAGDKAKATVGVSAEGMSPPSSNGFWGSFKSGLQSVSTQVGAIRSPSTGTSNFPLPTTFAGFREVTTAARTAGGRAVARGISQGYSAAKGGASDIWHAEDNKIRHKLLQQQDVVAKQCQRSTLHWVERQGTTALAIVCGGSVHLHTVQRVSRRKGDITVIGLKHERYAQKTFALPRLNLKGNNSNGTIKPLSCANEGPHGFWSLRQSAQISHSTHRRATTSSPNNAALLINGVNAMTLHQSMDEVETNPPYCPFHIDSRINIYAFATEDTSQTLIANSGETALDRWMRRGHVGDKNKNLRSALAVSSPATEPWLFGEPLPSSIKMNDGALSEGDDEFSHDLIDDKIGGLHDEGQDMTPPEYENEAAEDLMQSRFTIHSASVSGGLGAAGRERMEQVISVSTSRRAGGRKGKKQRQESHLHEDLEQLVGHDSDGIVHRRAFDGGDEEDRF